MTTALEVGEGSASHLCRSLTPGKTRYPLYRRLGELQGRSGQVRKISPPPGIQSPESPSRSQSLYRLSYPGPRCTETSVQITTIRYVISQKSVDPIYSRNSSHFSEVEGSLSYSQKQGTETYRHEPVKLRAQPHTIFHKILQEYEL